jgi:hypothetical protein
VEAGKGAQHQVERLEAAVEEARQKLARAEQQLYAWRQGAEGERQTAAILAQLEATGWVVLHDLHWPGRPFANIDHIAIGPTGIFVIDSKNWSGKVEVRNGVLRQNGYARTSECEGVASAAAAVSAFLEPQHRSLVAAVVCLLGHPTPAFQPPQARVVGAHELHAALAEGIVRLTAPEVTAIGGYLRGLLDGSRSPAMATTAALASAGVAPPEPARPRGRSAGRPARTTGRVSGSRRVARGVIKVCVAAVMVFVVVPAVLHAIADSLSTTDTRTPTVNPSPVSSKPAVRVSPTHSVVVKKR